MRRLLLAIAILASASTAATKDPVMPALTPEFEPFVGTWKRIHLDKKKQIPLFLVIKPEGGALRLRYQMAVRYKKYTSDWFGTIDVDLQVNMKEKHEIRYTVDPSQPAIMAADSIRFTNSPHAPRFELEASYTLADDGKALVYECKSIKTAKGEDSACPAPLRWTRESTDTKWPD